MLRAILLIMSISVASGCALPPAVQIGGSSGLGNKVVSAKEEPAKLVAVDGTLCHATPGRFEKTKTGDRVWCNWRPRGEG